MMRKVLAALALAGLAFAGPAISGTTHREPKEVEWSFNGPFGQYDQAQLQRGFKVYKEVCSACHALNFITFRNLGDPGGPFWDPRFPNSNDNPVVKALAKDAAPIGDIDSNTGDAITRPRTSADPLPAPFANDEAARASNNGAVPPDLSMVVLAREGGANYVYSILTGYTAPPTGLKVNDNQHYNPYMGGDMSAYWSGQGPAPEGGFIAMPQPLTEANRITADDGTDMTVDQEAKDVAAFLTWAADPKMEERKQTGFAVMIFLLIFAGVLYASYKAIWRNVAH